MPGSCQPLTYGAGFVRGVLDYADCQAQSIGEGGYQALAAPGSLLSLTLTALLTLFVAVQGYRLLLGHVPSAREGVLALVKIGIVLALATSWSAYRTLIYDVAFHGPAELAGVVGNAARLPGSGGGLTDRLQGVDQELLTLGELGVGNRDTGKAVTVVRIINGQSRTVVEPEHKPVGPIEPFALGVSRIVFLLGSLATLVSVRLLAGLLLALGPFFIAFLLFDATRGLFEGWLRALAGSALGALGVTIVLGVELALLEPWLAELITRRNYDLTIAGAPIELLVVAILFAFASIAAIGGAIRVALGFRFPLAWQSSSVQFVEALRGGRSNPPRVATVEHGAPAEQRSRASAIAEAIAITQRRESQVAAGPGAAPARTTSSAAGAREAPAAPVPLGRTYTRRTRNRVSGSAGRRDSGA